MEAKQLVGDLYTAGKTTGEIVDALKEKFNMDVNKNQVIGIKQRWFYELMRSIKAPPRPEGASIRKIPPIAGPPKTAIYTQKINDARSKDKEEHINVLMGNIENWRRNQCKYPGKVCNKNIQKKSYCEEHYFVCYVIKKEKPNVQ